MGKNLLPWGALQWQTSDFFFEFNKNILGDWVQSIMMVLLALLADLNIYAGTFIIC